MPRSIKAAGQAIPDEPRINFAITFNSKVNNVPGQRLQLPGDRLAAFHSTLALAERRRED